MEKTEKYNFQTTGNTLDSKVMLLEVNTHKNKVKSILSYKIDSIAKLSCFIIFFFVCINLINKIYWKFILNIYWKQYLSHTMQNNK